MRKRIVAGNWKMNKNLSEGLQLTSEIVNAVVANKPKLSSDELSIIIAPPFIHLNECAKTVKDNSYISVAAQNCYEKEKGAYTGEVSAEMIKSTGAEYIIIGHSERRTYFGENNQMLAQKVNLTLTNNLTPIYCCGETLKEREAGLLFEIIKTQITDGLFHLSAEQITKIVVAYEPVWAIGTGVTASKEQAQEMHSFIRKTIADKYGDNVAQQITILYGGSCNPTNAAELFACMDIDGGLIGGASLKADDFMKIIHSF